MQEVRRKKGEMRKTKRKGNNRVFIECLPHTLGTYQLPGPFAVPLALLGYFRRWIDLRQLR